MESYKNQITPEETLKLEDFKFDFSRFKKEIEDEESPEYFDYHDENSGIFFRIDEGEIEKIIFYPPKSNIAYLCTNEETSEIISGEKRIIDLILRNDVACRLKNGFANITELNLSSDEIFSGFPNNAKNKNAVRNQKISVSTVAIDPENDVLTYNYEISAGKIIGRGSKVTWDLTGVSTGTYTITAWADDGCGKCGRDITKTVTVKDVPIVQKNKN